MGNLFHPLAYARDNEFVVKQSLNKFYQLRELELHQRSSGYGPDEILLLHPAIFVNEVCFT